MKRIKYLLIASVLFAQEIKAQEGPYKLNLKVDIPVIAVGMGASYYGYFHKILKKTPSDPATIASLDPNDISKFNRPATRQNQKNGSLITDYFFTGIAAPLFLIADPGVRSDLGTVSLMYLEALSITGMLYTMTAGHVNKYRPYAYNPDVPFDKRMRKGAKNSFYGGHPSATAAGMFFLASVFSDYHPESNWKYVLWSAAGASTLGNAYFRYKAGQHFPTDLMIGVGIGTAIGIGVPYFHKIKNDKVSLMPVIGPYQGAALTRRLN